MGKDVSGAALLNLGCGYKTTDAEGVVNIDFGVFLRIATAPVLRNLSPFIVGRGRIEKLRRLGGNILVYDISSGIPAADNSVAAVYHSHMLEHLDRDVAVEFMREVARVLRPGGIHRIAVPDLEYSVRRYIEHLESDDQAEAHDTYIGAMLEQSVRREAAGTSAQTGGRRILERLVLGDARKRGETHQWMYDYKSLSELLSRTGFTNIRRYRFGESAVPHWTDYKLEFNESGGEYKPHSLYVEALV
jgi:predicted SAM-dependent methyltransferase